MSKLFGKTREIDMCTGPLFRKIMIFALPIMASNILQSLFNAADTMVVGRFSAEGASSMAAVGGVGTVISLFTNLAIGLSVGTNVLVSRYYGEKNPEKLSRAVHTSMTLSILLGIVVGVLGILATPLLLKFVAVPEDIRHLSQQYMVVIFAGYLFTLVYNFASSVLRAVGDTQRPLLFMMFAGVLNVALNLIFVVFLNMSVLGVALATVISQAVSAALTVMALLKTNSVCRLELHKLRIDGSALKQILRIGIPSGIQGTLFSFSNAVVQSSINSFGTAVMAGHTAASNVEGVLYMGIVALGNTAIAFTGQNTGAHKPDMIRKVLYHCLLLNLIFSAFSVAAMVFFGEGLLRLYGVTDPAALQAGMIQYRYEGYTLVLCTLMEILPGTLRGMGKGVEPTVITLLGSCVLRVVWIKTVFARWPKLENVFLVYPISWIVTGIALGISIFLTLRKLEKSWRAGQTA